jgi:hypothetical protein
MGRCSTWRCCRLYGGARVVVPAEVIARIERHVAEIGQAQVRDARRVRSQSKWSGNEALLPRPRSSYPAVAAIARSSPPEGSGVTARRRVARLTRTDHVAIEKVPTGVRLLVTAAIASRPGRSTSRDTPCASMNVRMRGSHGCKFQFSRMFSKTRVWPLRGPFDATAGPTKDRSW